MIANIHKTLVVASLAASGAAFAQTPAPAPDYTLSYNVGVVSEYRYRGIAQSRLKPALQGGVDFGHSSGLYLGVWGSTIKWIKDAGGDAPVETDFYGGYKGTAGGIGYDVGVLRYQYIHHELASSPNTTELYGAVTLGPATLKYSHAISDLFGFDNSKNSYYVDLTANFDLGNGWSLAPHVGYQRVNHYSDYSYADYALTLGKDLGSGFSASAALIGTNADKALYVTPSGKFTGKTMVVVGIKYAF